MTEEVARDIPTWTLGDRLRKAREHARLEQGELAARIGISRGTVSNYELGHGQRPPKLIVLRAWADECHVPLEWLAGDDYLSLVGSSIARSRNQSIRGCTGSTRRRESSPAVACAA